MMKVASVGAHCCRAGLEGRVPAAYWESKTGYTSSCCTTQRKQTRREIRLQTCRPGSSGMGLLARHLRLSSPADKQLNLPTVYITLGLKLPKAWLLTSSGIGWD